MYFGLILNIFSRGVNTNSGGLKAPEGGGG